MPGELLVQHTPVIGSCTCPPGQAAKADGAPTKGTATNIPAHADAINSPRILNRIFIRMILQSRIRG